MKIEKISKKEILKRKLAGHELPQIKILSVKDVDMVEMTMDIPDDILSELVEYGKKIATREDYFRIAFHKALEEGLKELGQKPRKGKSK